MKEALPTLQTQIPKLAALFGQGVATEATLNSPTTMNVNTLIAEQLVARAIDKSAEGVAGVGGGNVSVNNIDGRSNNSSVAVQNKSIATDPVVRAMGGTG